MVSEGRKCYLFMFCISFCCLVLSFIYIPIPLISDEHGENMLLKKSKNFKKKAFRPSTHVARCWGIMMKAVCALNLHKRLPACLRQWVNQLKPYVTQQSHLCSRLTILLFCLRYYLDVNFSGGKKVIVTSYQQLFLKDTATKSKWNILKQLKMTFPKNN